MQIILTKLQLGIVSRPVFIRWMQTWTVLDDDLRCCENPYKVLQRISVWCPNLNLKQLAKNKWREVNNYIIFLGFIFLLNKQRFLADFYVVRIFTTCFFKKKMCFSRNNEVLVLIHIIYTKEPCSKMEQVIKFIA